MRTCRISFRTPAPLLAALLLASVVRTGSASSTDVGSWTLLHGPLDAPAGLYHSAVYDAAHRRLLTFGYMNGAVYALPPDGPAEWHLLPCEGTAPRSWGEGSAVVDPVRQRVLWFGGKCDAVLPCAEPTVFALGLTGTRSSRLAKPNERSSTILPSRATMSCPERSPRPTSGRQ